MKAKICTWIAIGLLTAGSFAACDDNSEKNLALADSRIHLRMVEDFTLSPRTFQLHCVTEKIYPCVNFPIVARSRQSSKSIDISFEGVIETDICLTAIGPATTTIDLGALSEGAYALNLRNGGVTQTGTLVVEAGSYTVVFDESDSFAFADKRLNRIPEQTIWGYVGYDQQEEFLTLLKGLGAEEKNFSPGDYREFQIDENGKRIQSSGPERNHYFVFRYAGDPAAIDAMMRRYAEKYRGQYVYTAVYTDRGEQFLSWMYDR